MLPMVSDAAPAEAQYVLGDYEVPAGTHVLRGLVATGLLQVGDAVVCDGSVAGGKGVVLGRNVVVHGDVLSNGSIHLGAGSKVDGQVRSLEPVPVAEAVVPLNDSNRAAREVVPVAVQSTLRMLLDLAQTAQREGFGESSMKDGWWSLEHEPLASTLDGLRDMLAEGYHYGDHTIPWSADEIFELLLPRVLAPVIPLTVARKGDEYAALMLGRPTHLVGEDAVGWAKPASTLVDLVGTAVNPAFHMEVVGSREVLRPDANPEKLAAVVRLKRKLDPEPQTG